MKFKFSEELKKNNLVKSNGERNVLIVLRCKKCSTIHKDSPSALLFYKLKLEKQQLHCQKCHTKAFTRSCRHIEQDELYRIALMKTTHTKNHIEEELSQFTKRDISSAIRVTTEPPKNKDDQLTRLRQIKELEANG